jgi:hypothetical protein
VSAKKLFWPFLGGSVDYDTDSKLISDWANPGSPMWTKFDEMKDAYDGGKDPSVVWVELCQTYNQGTQVGYSGAEEEIANVRAHAPTAKIYVSPLQSYDPPTMCPLMGPNGEGVADLTNMANELVNAGLASAGPGAGGNPPLGPLTPQDAYSDGCHPTGDPTHGPGTSAEMLGQQLANFFDNL